MNITYVSALYNIYNTNKFSDTLSINVQNLLSSNLKVYLYVDDFFYNVIKQLKVNDNIKIILKPINELIIYNCIINKKDTLTLPNNRCHEKDTCEYMALMNSKIEFIKYTLPLIDTPYIAWIDAGISKIFKNINKSYTILSTI